VHRAFLVPPSGPRLRHRSALTSVLKEEAEDPHLVIRCLSLAFSRTLLGGEPPRETHVLSAMAVAGSVLQSRSDPRVRRDPRAGRRGRRDPRAGRRDRGVPRLLGRRRDGPPLAGRRSSQLGHRRGLLLTAVDGHRGMASRRVGELRESSRQAAGPSMRSVAAPPSACRKQRGDRRGHSCKARVAGAQTRRSLPKSEVRRSRVPAAPRTAEGERAPARMQVGRLCGLGGGGGGGTAGL
jgi:hypothetical protein